MFCCQPQVDACGITVFGLVLHVQNANIIVMKRVSLVRKVK